LASTDKVCGRFVANYDNSGGSAGDINGEAEQGVFRWANGDSITIANIGSACYASDDQTVNQSDSAGTRPFAGIVVDVDSTGVWVLQGLFLAASASGAAAASAAMPRMYGVRSASTANVAALATFTVSNDGVTLVEGDYVLLKDQSAPAENGIYVVGTVGGGTAPLTRATFFDDATEVAPGAVVHISEGTANADDFYFLATNETITVGTTSLTFTRNPDLALLASTAASAGASLIGIQDAGGLITAATVEGALAELAQHNQTAQAYLHLPLTNFVDAETAAGTPLTLFVDAVATLPGLSIVDAEALAIRWNNHATPGDVMQSIPLPEDLDDTADFTIHYMVSKSGATLGDAVTFDSAIVFQTDGALHDADTPVVDTSSALVGDAAAKTVTELEATFAAADIPSGAKVMNIMIHPTDGTLGTDDCHLLGVWIEYTRRTLTS